MSVANLELLLVTGITLGSIYLVFSLGLSLSWGVGKVLNLAHGAILVFAVFSTYEVSAHLRLSFPAAICIAMATGAALNVIMDLACFRPIRRATKTQDEAELAMLIASIGATAIFGGVVDQETDFSVVGLPPSIFRPVSYHLGSVTITNLDIIIVVLAIVLGGGLSAIIALTSLGRSLRAVAYSRDIASLLGIASDRMLTGLMLVSGALAGLGGILLVLDVGSFTSQTGQPLILKAFAIIVVGGVGSIAGSVVVAYVLAFAETATVVYGFGGTFKDAIAFGLILVALLVIPQGLFGAVKAERS
jgi:branched-chain amino acid transport system permease protein